MDEELPAPPRNLKQTTGLKHKSGVNFDIFTCEYLDTDDGRALAARVCPRLGYTQCCYHVVPDVLDAPHLNTLRLQDNATKARASLRTGRMYQFSHSVKHNIITGEDLHRPATVSEQFQIRAPWEIGQQAVPSKALNSS